MCCPIGCTELLCCPIEIQVKVKMVNEYTQKYSTDSIHHLQCRIYSICVLVYSEKSEISTESDFCSRSYFHSSRTFSDTNLQ